MSKLLTRVGMGPPAANLVRVEGEWVQLEGALLEFRGMSRKIFTSGVTDVAAGSDLQDLVIPGIHTDSQGAKTPMFLQTAPIVAQAVQEALAQLGLPSVSGYPAGRYALVLQNGVWALDPLGPAAGISAVTDSNVSAATVPENAANGTVVGITALCTHSGYTIAYSLTDSAGGKFAIHATTGVVTKAGALDYGTASSHNITVLATSSDTVSTASATFNIAVTDTVVSPGTGFLYREGPLLKLGSTTMYFVGTNNFSLTGCQSPSGAHTYAQMVTYFTDQRDANMVTRIWFFPHSNPTDMQNCMDAAEEVGAFIIPVLFEGAGHCGINYTANRAWYANPSNTYAHINSLCNTFKDYTCIAWWECCNEMGQGSGGDMTQAECKNWLHSVAARIKAVDTNHMVGSGCIGSWKSYHNGQAGYADVHNSIYIDLVSTHEYEYDSQNNTGVQGRHAQELAAAAQLNKPLYIGEFGTSRSSGGGTTEAVRRDVTLLKFDAYLNSSPNVCGVFHWATTKSYNAASPNVGAAANETYTGLTSIAIRDYTHTRLTGGGQSGGSGGGGGGGGTVYNTLTKTQRFDDAVWTKTGTIVTANAIADPLGGTNAEKLVETATTGAHSIFQQGPVSANGAFVMGVYVKAGERTNCTVHMTDSTSGSVYGILNLIDGTFTMPSSGSWTGPSVTTTNAGNGWWRVVCKGTRAAGTRSSIEIYLTPSLAFNNNYLGVAGSGIYVYGAGLEPGATDHGYQEVD